MENVKGQLSNISGHFEKAPSQQKDLKISHRQRVESIYIYIYISQISRRQYYKNIWFQITVSSIYAGIEVCVSFIYVQFDILWFCLRAA